MRSFVVSASILLLLLTAACNRGAVQQEKRSTQTPIQSTSVQAQKASPEKYSLLDNDPEYERLRKISPFELIETLPSYQKAVADRNGRIEANAKVGAISDPALRNSMLETVGATVPEIEKMKYYDEAERLLQEERTTYLNQHKDSYFLVATYEKYYPSAGIAVFNLAKPGGSETAKDFALNNFGASVQLDCDKGGDVISCNGEYGSPLDEPFVISYDRYKQDFIDYSRGREYALLLKVSPEQMDAMYAAVRAKLAVNMNAAYEEEMKAGGDHPEYAEGRFVQYGPQSEKVLRERIESYSRRQAIWLLGRGNPMHRHELHVTEAWFVVGNQEFGKIAPASQPITLGNIH